jgi:hypothetical protein
MGVVRPGGGGCAGPEMDVAFAGGRGLSLFVFRVFVVLLFVCHVGWGWVSGHVGVLIWGMEKR